jgi:hypothetical protein
MATMNTSIHEFNTRRLGLTRLKGILAAEALVAADDDQTQQANQADMRSLQWRSAIGGREVCCRRRHVAVTSRHSAGARGPNFPVSWAARTDWACAPFFELPVWAWHDNPKGAFVDWNKEVTFEKQ